MSCSGRWFLILWFHVFSLAGAAELRLSITGPDADRRPNLLLSGLTNGQYGIEASTNFLNWSRLITGAGTNGELPYLDTNAPGFARRYYRGIQLADVPPTVAPVVPLVNSNASTAGVITYFAGGQLSLTNDAGVRFTFTVAPSNVVDSVAVTMQLVTNFVSFPYENEQRSTVLFQPEGYVFEGAGVLEIQYPTKIPFLKFSSYSFNGQGSEFHLVPDVVTSNSVRIPVTHFSGVGAGIWTGTERTKAIVTHLDNAQFGFQQRLAGVLAEERMRQLLGSEGNGSRVTAELVTVSGEYYEQYLKPYFGAAGKDCGLARDLTRRILGLDRQWQLLGVGATPTAQFIGSETLQQWECNCLDEAIKACQNGTISDQSLVRRVLGLERQSQLLGGDGAGMSRCGHGSFNEFLSQATAGELPCAKPWMGTIEYTADGTRSWDCRLGFPGEIYCNQDSSESLSLFGDVDQVELQDESFPPFYSSLTWKLKFFTDATGSFTWNTRSSRRFECGAVETSQSNENGAGSGTLEVDCEFQFEDGELTSFTLDGNNQLIVKTLSNQSSNTTPCSKDDPGSHAGNVFPKQAPLSPIPALKDSVKNPIQFTKISPTELEGSVSGIGGGLNDIPLKYTWKFHLFRRQP